MSKIDYIRNKYLEFGIEVQVTKIEGEDIIDDVEYLYSSYVVEGVFCRMYNPLVVKYKRELDAGLSDRFNNLLDKFIESECHNINNNEYYKLLESEILNKIFPQHLRKQKLN